MVWARYTEFSRAEWSVVEWCGHQIEGVPVPMPDGRWRLIVVEGETT